MSENVMKGLDDENLDKIAGGDGNDYAESWNYGIVTCDSCNCEFKHGYAGQIQCPACGHWIPVGTWPKLFRRIPKEEY